MDIEQRVLDVAKKALATKTHREFDDYWSDIGIQFDLNTWIDEDGTKHAALYAVENGDTNIQEWTNLDYMIRQGKE